MCDARASSGPFPCLLAALFLSFRRHHLISFSSTNISINDPRYAHSPPPTAPPPPPPPCGGDPFWCFTECFTSRKSLWVYTRAGEVTNGASIATAAEVGSRDRKAAGLFDQHSPAPQRQPWGTMRSSLLHGGTRMRQRMTSSKRRQRAGLRYPRQSGISGSS